MTDIKYTNDHEWIKLEGGVAWIGITEYARHALGDLVYLELPDTGRKLTKGENFAVVESVKAASEIYTPVSGEIVEVNSALQDDLENLKEDISTGWIIKVQVADETELASLMDKASYEKFTESLS